jgi:hypothetical protein
MPKYMLQVRFNGARAAIDALPPGEQQNVFAEFEAVGHASGVLDANQLQLTGTAATVRVTGGETRVTDGPAVEPGAALDGYYLYDAPGLTAAIALAARIPVARLGGSVEVRPVVER